MLCASLKQIMQIDIVIDDMIGSYVIGGPSVDCLS